MYVVGLCSLRLDCVCTHICIQVSIKKINKNAFLNNNCHYSQKVGVDNRVKPNQNSMFDLGCSGSCWEFLCQTLNRIIVRNFGSGYWENILVQVQCTILYQYSNRITVQFHFRNVISVRVQVGKKDWLELQIFCPPLPKWKHWTKMTRLFS